MKKENILITGGNGFIGSHISTRLVEMGYHVLVICRRNKSHNPLFNKYLEEGKIEIFQGSIDSFDYSNLPEVSYIIHAAGKVSVYGKMKDFMQVNYKSTESLLEFAKKQKKLKCFTYLSTAAVYGYTGYIHLTENAENKPFNNP